MSLQPTSVAKRTAVMKQRKQDTEHDHGHGHGHGHSHGSRSRSRSQTQSETNYALIPLSAIIMLTTLTLYFCWPTGDLWDPPISHAMTFTDWKWRVPSVPGIRTAIGSKKPGPNIVFPAIDKKLSENRILSISGEHGIGKSEVVLQYIEWVSDGKKNSQIDESADKVTSSPPFVGPYSVVIWLYATSPTHVAAQYVQLANYLGIRTRKQTSDLVIPRVLAWLSEQPSFLLVFDNCPTKHIKLKDFEPFIPRDVNTHEVKQYGLQKDALQTQHIIFTSENPMHTNNMQMSALNTQSVTLLLQEISKDPSSSQSELSISQQDLTKIAEIVGGVPLRVLHTGIAIRLLGKSNAYEGKQQQLIQKIKKGNALLDVIQEEKIMWQLLQFISVFNKEDIPYQVLQNWIQHLKVEEHNSALDEALTLLHDYKLIKLYTDKITKKKSIFIFAIVQDAVLSSMSNQAKGQVILQAFGSLASTLPNFSLFSLSPSNPDDYNPSVTYSSKNSHPWLISSMYLQHTWVLTKSLAKLLPDIQEVDDSHNISQILEFCSQTGHYFMTLYKEPKKARKIFQLALSLSELELFSSNVPSNLEPPLLFNMGSVSLELGKASKANGYYTKAHTICLKSNDRIAESLCYLANVEKEKGSITQARKYFDECIMKQKQKEESREQKAQLAQFFGRKAQFELSIGSKSDAIILLELALDLEIQVFDKISDPVVERMDSLADTWISLGRQREALRMAQRSLRLSKEFLDGFDPALAPRLVLVGQLQLDLAGSRSSRYLRSAKRMFDSAFEIDIEAAGAIHPVVVKRLRKQSEIELILGNVEEALMRCHRALGISVHLYGIEYETSTQLFTKCKELFTIIKQHDLQKQQAEKRKQEK